MSSVQERLAARREQLQHDRFCELPVPGYEDILLARYRILGRTELKPIARNNAGQDEDEQELCNALDTLIQACEDLLELKGSEDGKPVYESLGRKWTVATAREYFGVELPTDATARDALLAIFPPTQTELLAHFIAYDAELLTTAAEVDGAIQGNSEARSAAEEPSISQ